MSDKSVTQKLLIKANYKVLTVNAPKDYMAKIGELPSDVVFLQESNQLVDLVHVFVTSKKELAALLESVKFVLKPQGLLWVSYPKGTSKVETDINRDIIWQYAQTVGFQAVSMIAVDNIWSALRLKVV